MRLRKVLLVFPIIVAGCMSTVVSQGQFQSAQSALFELQQIEQAALLGAYSSPQSFDLIAPNYVQVINGFRVAMPVDSPRNNRRGLERSQLSTSIDNCIEGVETLARIHRTSGLDDDPSDFLVIETCQSTLDVMRRSQ